MRFLQKKKNDKNHRGFCNNSLNLDQLLLIEFRFFNFLLTNISITKILNNLKL